MNDKIICKKVSAMLSIYIDNKVTYPERAFIEEHLANCESCYKKYTYLKSLIKNLKDSYKQIVELAVKKQKQETFNIMEHEKFLANLSPYVDNELGGQECYEFRKYLTKSKTAQKELRNTYLLQKELKQSYNKIKKKMSIAMSYRILNAVRSNAMNGHSYFLQRYFNSKTAWAAILMGVLLLGSYGVMNLNNLQPKETVQITTQEQISDTRAENTEVVTNDFFEF